MRPLRVIQWNGAKVWAGAEVRLVEACERLAARGHRVFAVTRGGSPLEAHLRDAVSAGVEVFGAAPHSAADLPRFLGAAALARRLRADVIHAHAGRDYVPAILAARLAGCPLVLHRHLFIPLKPGTAALVRRYADAVIAVSGPVAEGLAGSDGVPAEKIHRVPMLVDPRRIECPPGAAAEVRRALGLSGRPLILSVGHLHASKGHADLIRAAAKLHAAGRQFLLAIAGEGDERPALEQLIAENGLGECVRLLGMRDDVPALMAASDLFALLSWEDPFPGAILEAMAAGKPVVACNAGGVPEMVADGETGALVPPHAPAQAAQAVARLLADAELRRRWGEAGRDRAAACFSYDGMLDAWERIYAAVLAKRGRA